MTAFPLTRCRRSFFFVRSGRFSPLFIGGGDVLAVGSTSFQLCRPIRELLFAPLLFSADETCKPVRQEHCAFFFPTLPFLPAGLFSAP